MRLSIQVQGFKEIERLTRSKKKQLGKPTQSVLVGYGGDDVVNTTGEGYAVYVHEDTDAEHKPPTQSKFLIDAPVEVDELASIVSQCLNNGDSLIEGLEEAGQLVLERSEPLVPVAEGHLVGSGFVRREDQDE